MQIKFIIMTSKLKENIEIINKTVYDRTVVILQMIFFYFQKKHYLQ